MGTLITSAPRERTINIWERKVIILIFPTEDGNYYSTGSNYYL